jgi:hypothetical protein
MASSRGLVLERYDGTHLTYGDGIERNFHAALRTALTAAENRERLLREFVAFRRSAVARASAARARTCSTPPRRAARRAPRAHAGGQWHRGAARAVAVPRGGRDFVAGSMIVPLDQPAGRLVRNLLDPQVEMDADFVQRQRERRAQRLRDEIYDITAWSMPMLWGIDAPAVDGRWTCVGRRARRSPSSRGPRRGGADQRRRRERAVAERRVQRQAARRSQCCRSRARRLGHAVGHGYGRRGRRSAGDGIPCTPPAPRSGSTAAATARARPSSGRRPRRRPARPLAAIAARRGRGRGRAERVRRGGHLPRQQPDACAARAARAAALGRAHVEPVGGLDALGARARYGQRATAVRAGSFGRADLGRYDVIVMPSGNYAALARRRAAAAELGAGRRHAHHDGRSDDVGGARERRACSPRGRKRGSAWQRGARPAAGGQPIDLLEAITPEREQPEPISGAIIRVALDRSHVLAAGSTPEIGAMVAGSRVFSPMTLDRGTNVGVYAPLDRLVMSGIVWDEARPQLASKAFLMHQPLGRGRIIAFAEDPNFRGYAEATQLLFMNAVLLGPAF